LVISRGLSDKDRAVVATMRMRLSLKQALEYLKDIGFEMSLPTYTRIKRKLNSHKLQRLYHVAKIGFTDEHLAAIDNLELIQKLMWQDYHNCKDPFKRTCILEKIANIQPYLSSYYETTKDIIENSNISSDTVKRKLRRIEEQQLEEELNDAKPI
jgi:hypothetical protein